MRGPLKGVVASGMRKTIPASFRVYHQGSVGWSLTTKSTILVHWIDASENLRD